jgi:hypothetical protein
MKKHSALSAAILFFIITILLTANNSINADTNTELAAQTADPGASLIQLTLQETYSPTNHKGKGYSNELQFQPVIPIKASSIIPWPQLNRPTIPLETSAGPARKTSMGDIEDIHLFVPISKTHFTYGFGAEISIPTASADVNGSGKWQFGPALYVLYAGISNLQIGALVRDTVSFAGKSNRDGVHLLAMQPILQYNMPAGWYLSMGDFDWDFDWKNNGAATIPLAAQLGRVVKIGGHTYNLSIEYASYVANNGPSPKSSIRLGLTLLLPE